MNYVPVVAGNQTNGIVGTRDNIVVGQAKKKTEPEQEYILIPFCTTNPLISQGPKDSEEDVGMKPAEVNESGASDKGEEDEQDTRSKFERLLQQEKQTNSTNSFNTVGPPVNDTGIFGNAYDDEDVGAEADLNNLETAINVSLIPTTRINKDRPKDQIIGDLNLAIQTRRMTKVSNEHTMIDVSIWEDRKRMGYVCQPPGFKDPTFPDKVYKVEKALYRLHQAPRAWPDITFAVCVCARFQVTPKTSHLHAVKRIFRYLKGLVNKAVHKELGDRIERATTTASSLEAEQDSGEVQIQVLVDGKKIIVNEASIRHDLKLEDAEGTACLPNATIFEDLTRIGMVKNLENVNKFWMYLRFDQVFVNQQLGDMSKHKKTFVNPSLTKKLFGNMKREGTRFSRRKKQKSKRKQKKEAEVPQDETHHKESIPITSNDPLPSGEDRMQLTELMILCTNLQEQVLDLEKAKSDQAIELPASRKVGAARRVESSEDKDSLGDQEDPSKQGRNIADIDQDVNVTLIDETQRKLNDEYMFGVMIFMTRSSNLDRNQRSLSPMTITTVTTADTSVTTTSITRPKAKGLVFHDQEEQVFVSKPTVSSTQPSIKEKGKEIMIETERPLKKKDQVAADEELTRQLDAKMQAEIAEEEKIRRKKGKKKKSNIL
ncbi:ribonuclease H-like domain-containing protein [Tanacetum coccineum]